MNSFKIKDLISEKISGEWGNEQNGNHSVNVLRTTNFTNSGKINYNNVVKRDIEQSLIEKKKLIYGDIIIEKSGGSPTQPVGRVVFFDNQTKEIFLCNNFTAILRPSKNVFPKYLFYFLFFNHLTKKTLKFQNKTTGILNLKLERYLEEKIFFPSLPEQKRIAEILDKADSLRQKRKESIALLDELLKSVFLEMFGDPVRNEKGWEKKTFDNLISVERNQISPENIHNESIYVDLESIQKETGKILNYRKVQNGFIQSSKFRFTTKHILYGKLRPYLNKVALPSFSGVCSTDILPILPKENQSNKYFISQLMRHSYFVNYMNEKSSGANLPRVNVQTLYGYKTIIPPYNLQTQFAKIVKQVEATKAKMEESLKEMDNQFEGLLQRVFKDN